MILDLIIGVLQCAQCSSSSGPVQTNLVVGLTKVKVCILTPRLHPCSVNCWDTLCKQGGHFFKLVIPGFTTGTLQSWGLIQSKVSLHLWSKGKIVPQIGAERQTILETTSCYGACNIQEYLKAKKRKTSPTQGGSFLSVVKFFSSQLFGSHSSCLFC